MSSRMQKAILGRVYFEFHKATKTLKFSITPGVNRPEIRSAQGIQGLPERA